MQSQQPSQSLFAPLRPLDDDGPATDDFGRGEEARHAGDPQAAVQPLLPILERPRTYICPGEKHAIPRPIHLARLAAFYPNCRNCQHRTDTGQLPRSVVERIEHSARRVLVTSPFRTDGIRGEYLNQFTRKTAARIAAAVADRLWTDRPLTGCTDSLRLDPSSALGRRARGPLVVIGQDSRASSPDICVGVGASLRKMGCEVVDVGRVSRPCLTFAVDHLKAAAGIYVTGSGGPDSWTGLDILGEKGIPWSMNGTLADIERRSQKDVPRPTRGGGTQRFFDASLPYRASLLKHFQQLRPMRVVCACSELALLDALRLLFDDLPCELTTIHGDRRMRAGGERQAIIAAMDAAPDDTSVRCGVVIGEDGASLRWFADDRSLMPDADVLRRLLRADDLVQTGAAVVVAPDVDRESRAVLAELRMTAVDVEEGAEPLARAMYESSAVMGIESGGRYWFPDPFPHCDAAVTLGRLLQTLSRDASPERT